MTSAGGPARQSIQESRMINSFDRPDGADVLAMEPRRNGDPKASARPLRVALIGTFAPQKCGIATFTTDIYEQFRHFQPDVTIDLHVVREPAARATDAGADPAGLSTITPHHPRHFPPAARQ